MPSLGLIVHVADAIVREREGGNAPRVDEARMHALGLVEALPAWRQDVEKALDAAEFKGVKDIVVGGGVSANSYLREKLTRDAATQGIKVWFPPLLLSTDNAAMIARRGFELHKNRIRSSLNMTGDPALSIRAGRG